MPGGRSGAGRGEISLIAMNYDARPGFCQRGSLQIAARMSHLSHSTGSRCRAPMPEVVPKRGGLMDSLDWLLSAIDDPEAVRLNAILLLYCALIGVVLILRGRGRVLAPARRRPHGAD